MKNSLYRIEDDLLACGVINQAQLQEAKEIQNKEGLRIEDALARLGYTNSHEIIQCIARMHDMEVIDLEKVYMSPESMNMLPAKYITDHQIVPVTRDNEVITIAMSAPPDLEFVDNLRFMLNSDIKCVLATPESIQSYIRKYYDLGYNETVDLLLKEFITYEQQNHPEEANEKDRLKKSWEETSFEEAEERPIIQLVTLIINKAISAQASDIHIEPFSNRVRIRYRVDGVCREADVLPKRLQEAIISRIKILAGIDIAEKRRPQDGRISLKYAGKELDIRVSCLPSIYGESVVMRLLEKSTVLTSLKNLGFDENEYKQYQSLIKRPQGILLITGPTGSGKTTTLYASINELNDNSKKIVTAEDPVEYNIHGINQSQVCEKIGFNFPAILRTILRQDPDIILVGEIRDTETAETAIAAALTGHLVLSTLHTNDAPSAITRLVDMGIKPFLVASVLQGVMAQRLVRVICTKCKEPVTYNPEYLLKMGFEPDKLKDFVFYRGKGCKECSNIGYRGRMGIYELLVMNETIRDLTYGMAPIDEIRRVARNTGMKTLKEYGLKKVKEGKTTIEEVFRVTGT